MRFQRFDIRPGKIPRTTRRLKNAEKAIERERDSIPLFPELVRFKTVEQRLDHLDDCQIRYWQNIRDQLAQTWRKFRQRLYGLPEAERQRFLDYWNSRTMTPAQAYCASDALTNFFHRDDWRSEDIAKIQDAQRLLQEGAQL